MQVKRFLSGAAIGAMILRRCIAPVEAEELYSQAMTSIGTDLSQAVSSNLNNSENQQVASSFRLESDSSVETISWMGFYYESTLQPDIGGVQFTVRFFADEGNHPASVPFYDGAVAARWVNYKNTGNTTIYKFTASLPSPVMLSGGSRFWISILDSDARTETVFCWSTVAPRRADMWYVYRISDYARWYDLIEPGGFRFDLEGEIVSPAPPLIISRCRGQDETPEDGGATLHDEVPEGGGATFLVTVGGTPPFSYQWLLNSNSVPGATNSILSLSNLRYEDSGNYSVVVRNAAGSITDSVAELQVDKDVLLFQEMNSITDDLSPAAFSNLNNPQGQQVAQKFRLGADSLLQRVSWIGFYYGGALSTNQPTVQFTIRLFPDAGGLPSIVPLVEQTCSAAFVPYRTTASAPVYRFTIDLGSPVPLSAGLPYWISILDSDTRTPVGFRWSYIFGVGQDAVFRPSEGGTWSPPGGEFALLLQGTPAPPRVTASPQGQFASPGQMVTFSVSANGIEPLSYQWSFNGAVIPGATGRSLIIVDAQMKDAGVYAVKVNNRAGSVTSAPATLDVEDRRGGTVLFANITVHAPVFDSDGQTRLEGASYLAQLYAGSSEEALAPVGGAVPFLAGAAAGYWSPSIRYLPLTSPGQNALVQVRVWDSSTAPTFELASLAGSKLVVSKIISVTTGGFGSPPSLPGLLTGLESLRLRPAIRQAQFANTGHPLGDGGRLMTLITPTDSQFTVEASTNLADWKTLFNASSENGRIQLLDSSSANFEHRFYRARLSAP